MQEVVLFAPLPVKMLVSIKNFSCLGMDSQKTPNIPTYEVFQNPLKIDKSQADLGYTGSVTVVHSHKNSAQCFCKNMLHG